MIGKEPPKLAVVIVNFRSGDETAGLLKSLRDARGGGERNIYVVDSGSGDGSCDVIKSCLLGNEFLIEAGENLGYGACNNIGIRKGMEWGADYFLVLNPDVQLENDFLPPLLIALEARPRCGAAVPVTLSEDGSRIQSVGGDFSLWTGTARRRFFGKDPATLRRDFDRAVFAIGHCMLVKREFFEDVGLFHEGYFLYYEDVELGMRGSREYWETMVVYQSRVRHNDTTGERLFDPTVNLVATRNQVWVERSYAGSIRLLCFILFSLSLRWPWKFARCFFTFHFKASFMVIKGCWTGLFGRGLHGVSHLALPVVPRKARPDEPGSNSGEVVARWIQAQDAYLITKHKLDQNYRKRLK
jgi:GT2 family glycosyltransferase